MHIGSAIISNGALFLLIFLIYFIPSLIAHYRNLEEKHFMNIFLLNILLGWTVIGWIVALIMAFLKPPIQEDKKDFWSFME